MISILGCRVRRWLLALIAGAFLVACAQKPDAEGRTSYVGPAPPDAVARLGKGAIQVVAFSPDGDFLAVGDEVGLTLYRVETLEEVWLEPASSAVLSLAFSPDGRFLTAGAQNGSLLLLDAASGQIINSVRGDDEDNGIFALAWSREGAGEDGETLFAAGFNDGRVLVSSMDESVDGPDVTVLGLLERQKSGVTSLAFAPDGSVLASGNRSGVVNLWDAKNLVRLASLPGHEEAHAILALAWSPDGTTLLSGGRDERVIVWDVAIRSPQQTFTGHKAEVLSVAFLPGTDNVATADRNGTIILWRADDGAMVHSQIGTGRETISAASAPDGTRYAMASDDGSLAIRSFNPKGGENNGPLQMLTGHGTTARRVTSLAWAPNGQRLASALGSDVIVWNAATKEPLHVFAGHAAAASSVAWEVAGSRLASGDRDGTVLIWDSETGEQLMAMSGHSDNVASLSWSPDGTRLASAGSLDDSVIIWDVYRGDALHTLHGDGTGLWSVAWSPDGDTLAVGTTFGEVWLWDVSGSGAPQPGDTLRRHLNWVAGLAWSPDGMRLASAGADNRIVLWDIASGDAAVLAGHSDVVRGVAFSPDGRQLASASRDELVIVWDVGPEAEDPLLKALVGHTEGVNGVAWSPDGNAFASGSDDGTVILWD